MFITRATRHDRSDLDEFFSRNGWEGPHLDRGIGFVARDGGVVGTLRLIELEPQTVVVEDVVVDEARRGEGIGAQIMRAAMNSRGGTLFLCCHPETRGFYEKHGFGEVPFDQLPASVRTFFEEEEAAPHQIEEGHVHHFMTAR